MTFIDSLGMRRWFDQGVAYGDIGVLPWMRGPGGGLRIGLVAILTDLVIGIPATGRTASTVELSVRWTATPPTAGRVNSAGRVLKWGKRLMFGDASLTDESGAVVGWAAGTFVTGEIGNPSELTTTPGELSDPVGVHQSMEEALQVDVSEAGVVVMPMRPEVVNGPGGAVQGGIQACLAELAAERAMPGLHEVTDLAIRYVRRVDVGPVRAVATVLPGSGPDPTVLVELLDAGAGDRLMTHVLATIRPL